MKRIGLTLGAVMVLMGCAYSAAHWHTEGLMRVARADLPTQLPPGDAREGERLSRVLGCQGCHGIDLAGQVFADIPYAALLVAANLSTTLPHYDDADFIRLMRSGAKRDGRLALVMPNKAFQRLDDQELADLLVYLRSVGKVERELPPTQLRPLGRIGAVIGHYDITALHADPPESPAVLADRSHTDRGRRLLMVACSECHGMDLAGSSDEGTPPLKVLLAYDDAEFTRLMREGITKSGGESATGFMSAVARHRFAVLSDAEIAAMRDYIVRNPN